MLLHPVTYYFAHTWTTNSLSSGPYLLGQTQMTRNKCNRHGIPHLPYQMTYSIRRFVGTLNYEEKHKKVKGFFTFSQPAAS